VVVGDVLSLLRAVDGGVTATAHLPKRKEKKSVKRELLKYYGVSMLTAAMALGAMLLPAPAVAQAAA
jgi:hypothetical protein